MKTSPHEGKFKMADSAFLRQR